MSARQHRSADLRPVSAGGKAAGSSRRFAAIAATSLLLLLSTCGPPVTSRPLGPALASDARLDADGERWVERTLRSLTLRQRVAQLVVVWIPGSYTSTDAAEFDELVGLVAGQGIGGLAISVGQPHTYAAKLNALQRRSPIPLLVASDFESGGPGMRLGGVYALPYLLNLGGGTVFPPTMAFGAIGEERSAYELGRITGLEARAVGVHLTFAPVLDVNSNPENPIINTRSFAEDPQLVGRLGAAFIRGAHDAGLLTTGKHYPGHGDTRTDSHIDLPTIAADRQRLDSVELVPFKRAVEAGVDAIMTAHIAAPEILGPDGPPATLSSYFLSEVLRGELGFEGVIFTDALRMAAIVDHYGSAEAAVRALEAGADVLLAPANAVEAIDAVTAAVQTGRLSESRVDESLRRVLRLKARAGLRQGRLVDSEVVAEVVGRRRHLDFADSAAQRSITMPRDRQSLIPLDTSRLRRVLSLTYSGRSDPVAGLNFNNLLAGQVDSLMSVWVDERTHAAKYEALLAETDSLDLVLASLYVGPRAGVGGVSLPATLAMFIDQLAATGKPLVVISFGNPYLLTELAGVGTYLIAWGAREVSQRAAARAILGQAPIDGTLPISLPPLHRAGEGLERPRSTRDDGARSGSSANGEV